MLANKTRQSLAVVLGLQNRNNEYVSSIKLAAMMKKTPKAGISRGTTAATTHSDGDLRCVLIAKV